MKDARDGVHNGATAYIFENIAPSLARASMCGVSTKTSRPKNER